MLDDKVALVIDDEPLIRMMLAEFLEDIGLTVYEAENGSEGIEIYRDKNPNIVIVDLRMPILDGFGFLTESEVVDNPDCHVIVLTGHGGMDDKSRAEALGADVFMKKPFESDELVDIVEKLLS